MDDDDIEQLHPLGKLCKKTRLGKHDEIDAYCINTLPCDFRIGARADVDKCQTCMYRIEYYKYRA